MLTSSKRLKKPLKRLEKPSDTSLQCHFPLSDENKTSNWMKICGLNQAQQCGVLEEGAVLRARVVIFGALHTNRYVYYPLCAFPGLIGPPLRRDRLRHPTLFHQ